ncbi:hypothetical protein NDU88_011230 [Pleurodeles waltl]|uniref:Secreted protein n=1 Tax=Pleurodeles waltl TaxID=8319 RepID=A0AAV7PY91_PLEWA|nr:hypothetical protein NDU88_011230 [Pleurodeles waltl]
MGLPRCCRVTAALTCYYGADALLWCRRTTRLRACMHPPLTCCYGADMCCVQCVLMKEETPLVLAHAAGILTPFKVQQILHRS